MVFSNSGKCATNYIKYKKGFYIMGNNITWDNLFGDGSDDKWKDLKDQADNDSDTLDNLWGDDN